MRLVTYVFVLASLLLCGRAQAGLLGTSVNSQYYAYNGPYDFAGSPASFTANGTVQETFCSGCPEGFSLAVSDTQIVYQLFGSGGYWSDSGPALNSGGLYIDNGNLLTFAGATISNVLLDSASSVAGFTASNVTFNDGNIAVDWAGLTGIASGEEIILDVSTATPSSTPEPAEWAILLTGLAVAGSWYHRRLQKSAFGNSAKEGTMQ